MCFFSQSDHGGSVVMGWDNGMEDEFLNFMKERKIDFSHIQYFSILYSFLKL